MPVLCSNYYSIFKCRGLTLRFGDRCGFCRARKLGVPLKEGKLPAHARSLYSSYPPVAIHDADDSDSEAESPGDDGNEGADIA